MTSKPANASSRATTRSSALATAARRPVLARVLEPLAFAAAACSVSLRLEGIDAYRAAQLGALFLVARLICDTSPNVIVCRRLEEAPYGEHYIRRVLATVKITLAVGFTVLVYFAARIIGGEAQALVIGSDGGGGTGGTGAARFLLGMPLVLASYAVAAPVVLQHRGVPVARPSLGPSVGAIIVALLCLSGALAPRTLLLAGVLALLFGNLVVGTAQRYRAATRRMRHPSIAFAFGDRSVAKHFHADDDRMLIRRALEIAPLMLLPVAPALLALFPPLGGAPASMIAATLAASIAATPAILFDAKLGSRRFALTALLCALAAVAASFRAEAPPDAQVLRASAALLLAFPGLSRLIARGDGRFVASALCVWALARGLVAPPWPELLLALVAAALAVAPERRAR